ncbi:MAG: extracellular solute-binding protein [Nitrospinota bacterium]|nr:MAG: extracellular solute-binding protein [Nitrospinota bacterium]
MVQQVARGISRRDFIKTTGAGGLALGLASLLGATRVVAEPRTLKIGQWSHFVPAFDDWFDNKFTKEWGEKYDVKVIVDHITSTELRARAAAEVAAQKGHDLFKFNDPPPAYEDQVIDHADIIQEVERRKGKYIDLAKKSTYNPKTGKYFGFSDNFVPDPGNYRKDLWDEVGMVPDTWEDVRIGGAKIKKKFGNPVGIGLSQEIDTNMAMRAIMYSHGSTVQDEEGQVVINSKATVEAVKYVRALYKETMTPEVFTWDPSSNNRFLISGRGSYILNAISALRTAQKTNPDVAKNIFLWKTPEGPVKRQGLEHVMGVYVIWKFAENIDLAKQFLIDYIDNFEEAFRASEFYDFPTFENAVPDLEAAISNDAASHPPDKLKVIGTALEWATNVGYPGYATAPIDEVFNTYVIPTMFAKAARDELSPEEAVRAAEKEIKRIFAKWEKK